MEVSRSPQPDDAPWNFGLKHLASEGDWTNTPVSCWDGRARQRGPGTIVWCPGQTHYSFGRIGFTWELVRNAESQPHLRLSESECALNNDSCAPDGLRSPALYLLHLNGQHWYPKIWAGSQESCFPKYCMALRSMFNLFMPLSLHQLQDLTLFSCKWYHGDKTKSLRLKLYCWVHDLWDLGN